MTWVGVHRAAVADAGRSGIEFQASIDRVACQCAAWIVKAEDGKLIGIDDGLSTYRCVVCQRQFQSPSWGAVIHGSQRGASHRGRSNLVLEIVVAVNKVGELAQEKIVEARIVDERVGVRDDHIVVGRAANHGRSIEAHRRREVGDIVAVALAQDGRGCGRGARKRTAAAVGSRGSDCVVV